MKVEYLYVAPAIPCSNMVYNGFRYTKCLCNMFPADLIRKHNADFFYIVSRKFAAFVKHGFCVSGIFGRRAIFKIIESIIDFIAVLMIYFITNRSNPNKSSHYGAMQSNHFSFGINARSNKIISVSTQGRFKNPTILNAFRVKKFLNCKPATIIQFSYMDFCFPLVEKIFYIINVFLGKDGFWPSLRDTSSYSIIANFIRAFISDHWLPLFYQFNLLGCKKTSYRKKSITQLECVC